MYKLIILLNIILFSSCSKQLIIKDENTNELESALNSKFQKYSPILISDNLPKQVNEQSGLLEFDNLFWIINDSYCPAELLAYNIEGKLKRQKNISSHTNTDWESLADDKENIYIGDFGNNYGSRKDLKILKLEKSELSNSEDIIAEEINISYKEQNDFSNQKHNHNFDCEAFFEFNKQLYLFTKNWENHKSSIYKVSTQVGNYALSNPEFLDTDFMVTGADISADNKTIALIGYKDFHSYMCIIYDFEADKFAEGKKVFLDLESLKSAQTESVLFSSEGKLYIGSEESRNAKQSLYLIEWKKILNKE